MARELSDLKASHTSVQCTTHSKRSCFKTLFRSASKAQIRDLQRSLSRAESEIDLLQERWRSTRRCLIRTEDVLEEQRECMKVRIIALKHTQIELGAVRGKVQDMERMLGERKDLNEVLRERNRDLVVEIAALRHRAVVKDGKRNITI